VNKEKNLTKPPNPPASQEFESGTPSVGPYNRALGEIYQRLYPEIRRPKPNQEAIAAALHAMQRLTMEADSEGVAENAIVETNLRASSACHACGHRNREGNKFCGVCGVTLQAEASSASSASTPGSSEISVANPSSSPVAGGEMAEESRPLVPEAAEEVHPTARVAPGTHYYHHHYHHHYFQGANEVVAGARPNAPESAREADRLRVAAAAKGEPMSRSEAAVRRLTQEWMLACNTRQLDELIELYAADAVVLRSNLPAIRGAMAVREFFFSSLEAGLGEAALDPMRVDVIGDLAHEVGRYSALVPGTTGKRREERGKYLWIFAKQSSGDWKLTAECWCSDLTLAGAESDVPKLATPLASKVSTRKS
jgi:ketosteroid isomerase-like protein